MIIEKLKEIVQLQNNVKLDNIQQREEKNIISEILTTYYFLGYIHKEYLSIENANKEQSDLINKLFGVDKGEVAIEKKSFRNNVRLCLSAREKFFILFKTRYFQ